MSKLIYVLKSETKIYKKNFYELFQKLQKEFAKDFSIYFCLVGSSKRNLVIKHHNKGFDLDYYIIIRKIQK